jgi:diguanylate cyclase (GGDEF)-like protein
VRQRKGFKLRTILGLLVLGAVLVTAAAGSYSAVKANQAALTDNYLASNYQYAKKLASNTTSLLNVMQNNMDSIAIKARRHTISQTELDIWADANELYFNSIVVVGADRSLQAVSPVSAGVAVGTRLTSEASALAVKLKKPIISEPYKAASGRLILLISSPIFNEQGAYAGFVGGTIYMETDNVLSRLVNEHYYGDGSYVYAVDKNSHLIYHPQEERVMEIVKDNEVITKAIARQSGSQIIVSSKGIKYFAGYANEPVSGWGIVLQTPASVLDKPLMELVRHMTLLALPLFIVILLIAWAVSYLISSPLHALAIFSEQAILSRKANPLHMPKTGTYIYEVKQLHQSIGKHLHLLNDEIQSDGLTGLANRRTFDLTIEEWFEDHIPFSLILLDLDHFKRINDKHGHVKGDEVLRHLAGQMRAFTRADDLCFRYGGEEFGILLRLEGIETASDIAERLRKKMAESTSLTGESITISIGISLSDTKMGSANRVIEIADKALYRSKESGRNRTTVGG